MPRTLSTPAIEALMAQVTDEAFLILLSFEYVPTGEIFRCVLNTENVTSGGHVYEATYFEFTLPETGSGAPQGCEVSVDNVDQRMIGLLRSITEPLKVKIQLVLASSPNTIEMELSDLLMREVTWDALKIRGKLVSDDPLNQAFPAHLYEPRTFEGIF
jgi:hypothetical protein